jgi:methylated-DNA-[protein]-cysteine S-methyltransferase
MKKTIFFATLDSPIGPLLCTSNGDALTGIFMEVHKHGPVRTPEWRQDASKFQDAFRQLRDYFAGKRRTFDLPLAPQGTEFQQRVWKALLEIPFGETMSYGALAKTLGMPAASRAVGAANGRNPLSIVVPCHRVIGANGSLTGYGGGLPRKRWLLAHESA